MIGVCCYFLCVRVCVGKWVGGYVRARASTDVKTIG